MNNLGERHCNRQQVSVLGETGGLQYATDLRDGLDLLAREKQREVLMFDPQVEEIAVVRALRIAGLPRSASGDRVIPFRRIHDYTECCPRCLVAVHGPWP